MLAEYKSALRVLLPEGLTSATASSILKCHDDFSRGLRDDVQVIQILSKE